MRVEARVGLDHVRAGAHAPALVVETFVEAPGIAGARPQIGERVREAAEALATGGGRERPRAHLGDELEGRDRPDVRGAEGRPVGEEVHAVVPLQTRRGAPEAARGPPHREHRAAEAVPEARQPLQPDGLAQQARGALHGLNELPLERRRPLLFAGFPGTVAKLERVHRGRPLPSKCRPASPCKPTPGPSSRLAQARRVRSL